MKTTILIDWTARMLIHVTWQVAVIGLIVLSLQILLRGASPRRRYAVFMGLMASIIPCIAITMAATWPVGLDADHFVMTAEGPVPAYYTGTVSQSQTVGVYDGGDYRRVAVVFPDHHAATSAGASKATAPVIDEKLGGQAIPWADIRRWSVYTYLAGLALMTARLLMGLYGGQRLRSRSTAISEEAILRGLAAAAGRVGTRFTPAIAHCAHITAPTVVGLLRPMILVPLSFTSGLSPEQIEMILAHELAHIRRYDHWANLLQRVVEAILFFHPAVWYISSVIRHERELCCDDIVIATGGERLAYADSLVRVAESAGKTPALGLSASGADKNLRARVLRLIEGSEPVRLRMGRAVVISLGLIFILGGGVLFAQSRQVDEPVVSETAFEPQAESAPEPTQLAQAQAPIEEPSASEAELKEATEEARREEQEKLQSERRRLIAAELAEKVAQRNATATRFTPFEVTATTNLTMAEPDLFSSCHEIAFDDAMPAHSFAQSGMAAAVSFRILHYLPPDLSALELPGSGGPRIVGLRIFGQRYGADYDPALAPFIVTVQGDETILFEESFPYSIFGEEPGWADIILPELLPVNQLEAHRALTISIDPNNTAERGLRIFASARDGGHVGTRHARVGTVEGGFTGAPESGEWMMRLYVGRAIAPIALLQEVAPFYSNMRTPTTSRGEVPPATDEAVAIYQEVIAKYPNSASALDAAYMLAHAYGALERFPEALAVVRDEIDPRIENVGGEQGYARSMEAYYWKELGDLEKALVAYERAIDAPRSTHRYWRPSISSDYLKSEAGRLSEKLRSQHVQSLLGMISDGEGPARAESTEAARERYVTLLAEQEWEDAFIALNRWIATLRIEDGRDRQTYLPFFERYFAANSRTLTSEGTNTNRRSAWDRIHPLLSALEESGAYQDDVVQWRHGELVSTLAEEIGLGEEALNTLSHAIENYPLIEYADSKNLSYYHVLRASCFRLLAESSFDEAERNLLNAYLSDPRFAYVPLSSLRPSYEKAAAPERYLRLVKVIIELTSDKLRDDPNNAELKSYLEEYTEALKEAESATK